MFDWLNGGQPDSEARELQSRLTQLAALEARHAGLLSERGALKTGLEAFTQRYDAHLGPLHARFAALQAELAGSCMQAAASGPDPRAGHPFVADAPDDADAQAMTQQAADAPAPADALRRHYRAAARAVHPDRAEDETDRHLRGEIMSRINRAYRDGQTQAIPLLVEEYRQRREGYVHEAGQHLLAVLRRCAQRREQIAALRLELEALRASGPFRLWQSVHEAEARGEDRLAELGRGMRRQIARLEALLAARRTPDLKAEGVARAAPASADEPVAERADAVLRGPTQVSLAEFEIARLLDAHGLAFSYRLPLAADTSLVASFTIHAQGGQILLWEHLEAGGARDEEAVRSRWLQRLGAFGRHGFDAGIDLFVTRDRPEGGFDAVRLERLAAYLLSLARSPQ